MTVVMRPPNDFRPLNCKYRKGTKAVTAAGIIGMLTCTAWVFAADSFYFPAIAGGLFFYITMQGLKL